MGCGSNVIAADRRPLACALDNRLDNGAMAKVQTVKISMLMTQAGQRGV
jgi:hypothetical protein